MGLEIERKFLVRDESWRRLFVRKEEIRDGLIAISHDRKVRVRIADERATLTVKFKTQGLANVEFEYPIPFADAKELLAHHCLEPELAKTRFFVPEGRHTWHVDAYEGILEGVVLAEIELPNESANLTLPTWVAQEVTGDPSYKKINMVNARRTRLAEARDTSCRVDLPAPAQSG